MSATRTLAALRLGTPAVIGRIDDERVILDLRTVPSASDEPLEHAVRAALR
jgi:L-seryl-tRNA(Ser) seleniumtransferase